MGEYDTSIEEQMYIMEGLKRRAQQPREQEDQMFKKYQNRYEKLYFSRNNDIDNWKNYKSYLQEVVKRDQIEPYTNPHARSTFGPNPKVSSF